ncbi:ribosome maturation protein [Desarmillaria tabescens]|uniref:Ribosome maturation protein n=1 Tax=Armillaria tabescens TaxID=1929756 RepID=A0AA39TP99_ARMTA|nr:ribosome maturation protein [Desarmillaria tabescens]KAK0461728.1 ribosome maturation protein [Desarmillaria tabescens]
MTKSISKVIYKPDSQSTDEFCLLVHTEEYKKWKGGGDSIPLTEVVDSFQAFHSGQGPQGILGKPSNQQLDTVFGTSKDVDVALIILEKGRHQVTEGVQGSTFSTTNSARGTVAVDNRGKGFSGV